MSTSQQGNKNNNRKKAVDGNILLQRDVYTKYDTITFFHICLCKKGWGPDSHAISFMQALVQIFF